MLFASNVFLLYFLPILLAVYFVIPRRFRAARNAVLLIFSLIFYGYGSAKYLLLMLFSITANYLGGLGAGLCKTKGARRLSLILAVTAGLCGLGYYKYAGFFSETAHALFPAFPVFSVALPIGISFFTFQGISYVADVYRGNAKAQKNPFYVALYISLFPQLIAGPIVRYTQIEREITDRTETLHDVSRGLTRFCFGLAKKMILAGAAGEIADAVFGGAPSVSLAWLGALAYTAQIYFDFSAYSDMAIGLGRVFGFHFAENFNYPSVARTVTDFWRRWHISLSSWFRDYVYIPMGGSRVGKSRHILNLLIVWALTGFWHGAAWNFILWGLWFGVLLIAEKYLWGKKLEKHPLIGHLTTLLIVVFSWVLFRAEGIGGAFRYLGAMFGVGAAADSGRTVYYLLEYLPEWFLFILCALPVRVFVKKRLASSGSPAAKTLLAWGPKVLALILLAISYMKLSTGSFNPFIYFRF